MASILVEKKDHVFTLTINRPDKLNSYDNALLREMELAWYDFRDDDNMWVAILTGAGRAFCAGHDLAGLDRLGWELEPPSIHYGGLEIYKPIICAVNGHALGGGCSMVMACDIVIAAENATLGYPQPAYGVTSLGGHQRLPRLTFPRKAMEVMLTAERYTAQQFFEMGLVNKVVPLDQLMPEAHKFAQRLMKNGPLALFATKEDFVRGQRMPWLGDGIRFSQLNYFRCWQSEDRVEGMKAFEQKRPPVWKGK